MGIYSCIGKNKEEVLKSLFEGKSGIGIVPERKEMATSQPSVASWRNPTLRVLSTADSVYASRSMVSMPT